MAEFKQTGPFSRQTAANVEAMPGQIWGLLQGVGRKLGRAGQYLSSEKAARDYTNLLSGQLPQVGRSAAAQGPTRDIYEQPGVGYFDRSSGRFLGRGVAGGQTPIVLGTRDGVTPDLTQSDTYKQYAATPSGQFERYFKTPEMDQYFGAASRGTAAPKNVAAMQALAGQTVAPGKTPEELSAFYRAESAMGRAQMPEIQKQLGYEKGSNLAQWAEANPMLAQRLYAKEMGKREAAGQVTPGTTYAGTTTQPLGGEDFAVVANAVPAPWNQQGSKVSADFSGVVPFQAAKTTGEGMPAFQTTGEKAAEFLTKMKIGRAF